LSTQAKSSNVSCHQEGRQSDDAQNAETNKSDFSGRLHGDILQPNWVVHYPYLDRHELAAFCVGTETGAFSTQGYAARTCVGDPSARELL
jgi:hypothetical protein